MKLPRSPRCVSPLLPALVAGCALAGCFKSAAETVLVDAAARESSAGMGGSPGADAAEAGPATDAGVTPDADASVAPDADAGQVPDAGAGPGPDAEAGPTPEGGDAAGEAGGPPSPVDPFPDASTPGVYCCTGCPQPQVDVDAGFLLGSVSTPTNLFSGSVTGAAGDGVYYVVGPSGSVNRQQIPTDTTAGTYSVNGLLFCGDQTVKLVWSNAQGPCALVEQITRTGADGGACSAPDMQVSLAWDALGLDWELHLIRQGGHINDTTTMTDCTWTTCISSHPDWGVQGDPYDDPSKDVDNTSTYGPENIFLNRPEAITYAVMVEHWGSGQPQASGVVTINLAGQAPMVIAKTGLASHHVWKAATIAYPQQGAPAVVTAFQDDIDCTASWSGGCTLAIP
jgi:hypothetical protein